MTLFNSFYRRSGVYCFVVLSVALLATLLWTSVAVAQPAYVRVNQIGYETGAAPFRAYLMSTASESGATLGDRPDRDVVLDVVVEIGG